jgi:hypothetical protein
VAVSCPRRDSAASCSPAAQPSVRAASAATDASGRPCWSNPAASGRGEPQVGLAYLGQLAARSQPGQRQRRIAAAGQRQVQPGWPVLDQERERLTHLIGADHAVIVENEHGVGLGQVAGERTAGQLGPVPVPAVQFALHGLDPVRPVRRRAGDVGESATSTASRPAWPNRSCSRSQDGK